MTKNAEKTEDKIPVSNKEDVEFQVMTPQQRLSLASSRKDK